MDSTPVGQAPYRLGIVQRERNRVHIVLIGRIRLRIVIVLIVLAVADSAVPVLLNVLPPSAECMTNSCCCHSPEASDWYSTLSDATP